MDTQILKSNLNPAGEAAATAGADSGDIETEVADRFEALTSMRAQWDDFMESIGGEIFLTFDWLRIWWKYYGKDRRLKIFIFRQNGNIIGILPMFFSRIRLGPVWADVGKQAGSDFTPITMSVPIKKEFINQVIRKFYTLMTGYSFDILHIGPIAGLYDSYDELDKSCKQFFGKDRIVYSGSGGVQTYFKVAESLDEQIAALTKNERKRVKKCLRYAHEAGTLTSTFAGEDDFGRYFDKFVEMHRKRWNNDGKAGHFSEWPASYEFHREVAHSQMSLKRLRFLRVAVNDVCLGYQYNYRFGEKYFEFLDSRVQLEEIPFELGHMSLGHVVFAENVKKAIAENIKWFDSMRGEYEYKLRLGGRLYPVRNIFIYKKDAGARLRIKLFAAIAWLINVAYFKAWHSRIGPKLGFRPTRLWPKWIRTYSFSLLR